MNSKVQILVIPVIWICIHVSSEMVPRGRRSQSKVRHWSPSWRSDETPDLMKYQASVLLVTVIPVFHPHNHCLLWEQRAEANGRRI
jgi:hypothetical protein